MLKKEQAEDESLEKISVLVRSGQEKVSKSGSSTNMVNGIIVHEFTSPIVNSGETIQQIVVPTEMRVQVLQLAHSSLFAGHLGVLKTKGKVLVSFTWPDIHADVTPYKQSCDLYHAKG